MRLIEKAFAIAELDLKKNWKEIEGEKSNPLILECYKSVDDLDCPEMDRNDDEIPWCSCYMNKKIQEAGGRGTRSSSARSWLKWGRQSVGRVGDLVVFQRGNDGWSGHVGFVYEITDTQIYTLGGNESDNVMVKPYPRVNVLGYRTSKD